MFPKHVKYKVLPIFSPQNKPFKKVKRFHAYIFKVFTIEEIHSTIG